MLPTCGVPVSWGIFGTRGWGRKVVLIYPAGRHATQNSPPCYCKRSCWVHLREVLLNGLHDARLSTAIGQWHALHSTELSSMYQFCAMHPAERCNELHARSWSPAQPAAQPQKRRGEQSCLYTIPSRAPLPYNIKSFKSDGWLASLSWTVPRFRPSGRTFRPQ